ncbi:hypothetical protein [Escherichia coli]|uniref:hypothetical protein n=1 Tax=Escherichia coli TaxID=562 RepID=UPI0012FF93FC|nr:hypothetical protein [Escherichia coli]
MQKYWHLRLTYIYTITAPDTRLYGLALWLCRVLSSADNQRLTLTGCGLQRQQALLPRDRHPAPETQRLPSAPDEASLWSRQRQGKVTLHNIPPQAAPVPACAIFPPSDMPFGAAVSSE